MAALAVSVLSLVSVMALRLGWAVATIVCTLQGVLLALASLRLRGGDLHGHNQLGRAHLITVLRSSFVAVLAAMALEGELTQPLAWGAIFLGGVALILDGYDGYFARLDGTASRFGAWLDQEVDAALVATLSVLVYRGTDVGAVILVSGAWRYVFLAAVAAWPRLRGELPYSKRRRVCCVVQIGALLVCLVPVLPLPLVHAVAVLSVGGLSASFAIDILYLSARAR